MGTLLNIKKKSEFGHAKLRNDKSQLFDLEMVETELHNVLSDSKGVIREMCNQMLYKNLERLKNLSVLQRLILKVQKPACNYYHNQGIQIF